MFRARAVVLGAFVALGGAVVAACGTGHSGPQLGLGPTPGGAQLQLQLELPMVGLSSSAQVSYATTDGRPVLRGLVQPVGTPVYMQDSQGRRTVVEPKRDGTFDVHARLIPGANQFKFTAARLGTTNRTATLVIDWHGPAADAMQAKIQADPAKYLPPASAGLNRKLPPLGKLPAVIPTGATTTFAIDAIQANPPPATGGPGHWLSGFELTEYYPTLESWFVGALVPAPGLPSPHRIDWLYSAHGLSMEGDGIGLDGQQYHIQSLGAGGWIGQGGSVWYWRDGGYWKNASGAVTFPLSAGGWSNGAGGSYVPPPRGISFAPGPSRNLSYLRSVAVDPSVIPMGSHIFIPAYQSINGGWFEADDTGGAINGRHIDVFRPPPADPNSSDGLGLATGQNVYIVPPGAPLP
jgi:hypothetical protein